MQPDLDQGEANVRQVIAALEANPRPLIDFATGCLIMLGAKSEWSMDDNFETTEGLARLATKYGLPTAGNQDDEALVFWGHAAAVGGYEHELDRL